MTPLSLSVSFRVNMVLHVCNMRLKMSYIKIIDSNIKKFG